MGHRYIAVVVVVVGVGIDPTINRSESLPPHSF